MELTRVTIREEYGDTMSKYRVWAVPEIGRSEFYYVASVSAAIVVFDDHDNFDGYVAAGLEENLNDGNSIPDWSEWYDEETGADFEEFKDRDFDEEGD